MKPATPDDFGGDTHRAPALASPASIDVISLHLPLFIVGLGAVLLILGCFTGYEDRVHHPPVAPAPTADLAPMPPGLTDAGAIPTPNVAVVSTWNDIAGLPYSRRDEFLADFRSLKMQLESLNPAAANVSPTDALQAARSQLHMALNRLNNATEISWEAAKEQMGEAWEQYAAAYRSAQAGPRP